MTITAFEVENYACLKDVKLTLTPLHALVGPNDSGKSLLLNALHDAVAVIGEVGGRDRRTRFTAATRYRLGTPDCKVECSPATGGLRYGRANDTLLSPMLMESFRVGDRMPHLDALVRELKEQSSSVEKLQLWPSALRSNASPYEEKTPVRFQNENGHGLATLYDWLLRLGDGRFQQVSDELHRYFPSLRGIRVVVPQGQKSLVALRFVLADGSIVEPQEVSEGVLYFLAYRALSLCDPVKVLLLEEPEAGLHPARIAEVMRILRRITEDHGTQVILTTHSPLVVNELRPEEVSVVTRTPEAGTKAIRICDTPNFEMRSKVYALGELWLAYCNGTDEAPLLRGEAS